MTTADTPKRLSDASIFEAKEFASAMREWASKRGAGSGLLLVEGAKTIDALLSHIAALTAERGSVSEDRLGRPETYAYKYPDGFWRYGTGGREINGSKPIEQVGLYRFSAITQALTESSGQMDEEASAILRTLASVPDSADISETDAKVSVGLLRRLLASGQGTDGAEAMREAAAKQCDDVSSECSYEARKSNPYSEGFSDGADECASRIRALPVSADGRDAMPSWRDLTFEQRRDISTLLQQTAGARTRYEEVREYLSRSLKSKQPSDTGGEK